MPEFIEDSSKYASLYMIPELVEVPAKNGIPFLIEPIFVDKSLNNQISIFEP